MILTILSCLLALFLFAGGVTHIVNPTVFDGFIPGFIPNQPAHILAAIAELSTAIALIIPRFRAYGGLMAAALCAAYMPFHVWDLFRPDPVIAPLWAAMLRVVVQLGFIALGLALWARRAARL